jgi:5'-nucleotidase
MPPMPGAIDAFTELAGLFDTYILSTAPWRNPSAWQNKLEWVHTHLGVDRGTPTYKRLILSHNKSLNRGDFLVNDRPHHRGAEEFDGQLIHFGKDGTQKTWPDVVALLRTQA